MDIPNEKITRFMFSVDDLVMLEAYAEDERDLHDTISDLFCFNEHLFEKDPLVFLFFAEEWLKNRGLIVEIKLCPGLKWYERFLAKWFLLKTGRKAYELWGIKYFEKLGGDKDE